jgi:hypothetical protein
LPTANLAPPPRHAATRTSHHNTLHHTTVTHHNTLHTTTLRSSILHITTACIKTQYVVILIYYSIR